MEFLPIDKDLMPYEVEYELGSEDFSFHYHYNETYDFFTVDLYKNGELVVAGEKLVYGNPLFESTYDPRTHPAPTIIPLDPAGHENTVNWNNLNNTVFLILQSEAT